MGVILEGMALENKGLTQIRTYDVEKAVDTLENVLGSTVGVLGGIATFLYAPHSTVRRQKLRILPKIIQKC